MTEEQLSALLRLKRHEQPPPGYFDRLLEDVHRRQRAELLRRPLWKIALERWQTFFSEHSMGTLTYAGAMAGVVVVGAGAAALFTAGGGPSAPPEFAAQTAPPPPLIAPAAPALLQLPGTTVHLASAQPPLDFQQRAQPHTGAHDVPRYVIDARPVSYDASKITF